MQGKAKRNVDISYTLPVLVNVLFTYIIFICSFLRSQLPGENVFFFLFNFVVVSLVKKQTQEGEA